MKCTPQLELFPKGFGWEPALGEGSSCRHRGVQLAVTPAQLRVESLGGWCSVREQDAVHTLTGWVRIYKQTGEGFTARMDWNSEGHCSSLLPQKGKQKTGFDVFLFLVIRANLDHPLDTEKPAVSLWDWSFVDLIPEESLAVCPLLSPLVLNLNEFRSVNPFISLGIVLYLLF